jgi:hypothetical protein
MGNYSLELEISIAPTDSNRILGRNKYAKASLFKKVKTEIAHLVRGKAPKEPLTSFKISAHRYSPSFMDLDNCYSMLKPYIDGLKLSGIIQDDNWKLINHSNYVIKQTKVKQSEKKRIVLRVEEIEDMKPKRMATKKEMDSLIKYKKDKQDKKESF